MCRIFCVVVCAVLVGEFSGCGGGSSKPQGVSLAAQYQNAMKEASPDSRAKKLVIVAERQLKAGDTTNASISLDAAIIAAKQNTETQTRGKIMTQVAHALAQSKREHEAESLLTEAEKTVDKIEDPSGKLEVIIKSADIKGQYLNLADIAQTQLKACEKIVETFDDPKTKVSTTLQIVVAYYNMKAASDAERLLATATELTKNCPDSRKQAECYIELSEALAKMEMAEKSTEALVESHHVASKIEDPISRAYALKNLAEKMNRLGKKEDARKLANEMEQTIPKVSDGSMRNQLLDELDKLKVKL